MFLKLKNISFLSIKITKFLNKKICYNLIKNENYFINYKEVRSMKTEKNILIAFILNLGFGIFEFFGGLFTNSISIISDSIHDIADALSIGISLLLERKSNKKPDNEYTFGYVRYSVFGSLITILILIIGSILIIYNAIIRIKNPVNINYQGMIFFAIIGIIVNYLAVYFTKGGKSLNQKAVNLHMLEDVLGWIVVLIGAIIMSFTNINIIDPILSIFVALFIFKHAISNLKIIIDLFLEKTPKGIDLDKIKKDILTIEGIKDLHHIHIWSLDGYNNYAMMHIVSDKNNILIKNKIKNKLKEYNIFHTTIELETTKEECLDKDCQINNETSSNHQHHH